MLVYVKDVLVKRVNVKICKRVNLTDLLIMGMYIMGETRPSSGPL